jgi:hypothetical protein
MDLTVIRSMTALDNSLNGYGEFQRRHLQTFILTMKVTHSTIRHVLHYGWQDPRSIDALALARAPLEILYMLCLIFEDPTWVDAYLKEGWKKQYERFLLRREETRHLPRYDEYSNVTAPRLLEAHRQILGISDAQRRPSSTWRSERRCRREWRMKTSRTSRRSPGLSKHFPLATNGGCSSGSILITSSSAHSFTAFRTRCCSA